MKISVCIPQYNRCAHLLKAIDSVRAQTHPDVELVISDDGSTDDSRERVPKYLEQSGIKYRYIEQPKNVGYDANLRAALTGASGDYLFILGNDDALATPTTLAEVATLLDEYQPELAIGNLIDGENGPTAVRVNSTRSQTGGPALALKMFRALSCVTGLILKRSAFLQHDTSRYDGSIYVQMYLGSRIIASGGRLLTIQTPIAITGTDVGAGHANSYKDVLKDFDRKLNPITGGLDEVGRVVCEALWDYVDPSQRRRITTSVFSQLLTYSYSYWLYDYRQNGGAWAALNLALGCFPPRLLRKVDQSIFASAWIAPVYAGATFTLLVPLPVMSRIKDLVRARSLSHR